MNNNNQQMKQSKKALKQYIFIIREKGINNIKECGKKLYKLVSIISTLSICIGVLVFLWGKTTDNNQSDNDLIMKQIRKEIKNANIISINKADIHGFGNDSIIVTAANEVDNFSDINEMEGRLIVLDTINNKMLHDMNDILGIKSSYKATFTSFLSSEHVGLFPTNVTIKNLDLSPNQEFVVSYEVYGSTYGAYFPVIYRYSYDTEKYEVFGTFPIPHYIENKNFDSSTGKVTSITAIYENTSIDGYIPDDSMVDTSILTDGHNKYILPCYSDFCRAYWAESSFGETGLVVFFPDDNLDVYSINIYIPTIIDGKFQWYIYYSIKNTGLLHDCNISDIQHVISENAWGDWLIQS